MQVSQEQINELNAHLVVQLQKADYEPQLDKKLASYRSKMDMKGFRKGKVPKSIVKKMYGNQVLAETLNDVLSDSVNKYIEDNKLNILGYPIPANGQQIDVDINKTEDFEFKYEIGLAPEFKLSYEAKKPSFTKQLIKVEDKLIDEEVERVTKRFGKPEEVKTIKDEDMVNVTLTELSVAENGVENTTTITLDSIKEEADQKAFKKLKIDGEINIKPLTYFKQEPAAIEKHILGITEGELENKDAEFKLKVNSIKRIKPAKINEELLTQIYGKDNVKDEAEMRQKISEDIGNYFNQQSDKKLYNDLAEELIEKTEMTLPDEFLKRWIKISNEKPITAEKVEEEYPAFQRNLKWSLIVQKVGKENDIKVSNEEIETRTVAQLKEQMKQYGIMDLEEEHLKKYTQEMLQRKDHVNQMHETILEEKLFDYFKTKVTVKEKTVTLDEFNKQK